MREGAGLSGIFEPKAIAKAKIFERFSHDAAENGADHAAGQRPFGDTSGPQIHIVGGGIDLHVFVKGFVGERSSQISPVASATESAEFAVGVVGGNAVITAALDVQRGQIRAESAGFISEEMIGQLENKYPELIFLRF